MAQNFLIAAITDRSRIVVPVILLIFPVTVFLTITNNLCHQRSIIDIMYMSLDTCNTPNVYSAAVIHGRQSNGNEYLNIAAWSQVMHLYVFQYIQEHRLTKISSVKFTTPHLIAPSATYVKQSMTFQVACKLRQIHRNIIKWILASALYAKGKCLKYH